VLVTLDDAEPMLSEPNGPALIREILGGGSAGFGLVMAVTGIDALRPHPDLLRALLPCDKLAFTPQAEAIIAELHATYGDERPFTGSQRYSFVLHCGPTITTFGLIVGLGDRAMSPTEAQAWCDSALQAHGITPTPWQQVVDEPASWEDISAPPWVLRRHDDVWCLIHVVSQQGNVQSVTDAIQWATNHIHYRFTCTIDQWQRGPAPWQDGVRAFYVDVLSDLVPRDTTDEFRRMILDRL
jgi:hypothetical protein